MFDNDIRRGEMKKKKAANSNSNLQKRRFSFSYEISSFRLGFDVAMN